MSPDLEVVDCVKQTAWKADVVDRADSMSLNTC